MTSGQVVIGRYRYLFLAAAVMAYLVVTAGGMVCVTESGQGCPDWPGCYGRIVPPARTDAIIEFTHRFVAALTAPFMIAAAVAGLRKFRSLPWIAWSSAAALLFTAAVVVFGAFAVLTGLAPGVAAVDVSSALTVLALATIAAAAAFAAHRAPALARRPSFASPLARLALAALAASFLTLITGVLVARSGSLARCLGWPLYAGPWVPAEVAGWLPAARRLLAVASGLLVAAAVVQAWRLPGQQPAIRLVATAAGTLFATETLVGLLLAWGGPAVVLLVPYVAMAAGVWALLAALVLLAGLAAPATAGGRLRAAQPAVR